MLNPQHVTRLYVEECGRFQPSVMCQINTICFLNRVAYAPESKTLKLVFEELRRLGDQGSQTWISKACELPNCCGVESNIDYMLLIRMSLKDIVNDMQ